MGSSTSKPEYPFPVPGVPARYIPPPPSKSKSSKWSSTFSMRRRSKKDRDRDRYDDFIMPKFPTPTAGMYPALPYYPSAYPTYYAPVQMAVVPMGMQQPFLGMPQPYVMPTYQATAAPVQPAVAPAPAPVVRMPTAPTPAPIPVPPPASALAPSQMPHPPSAPSAASQMPQPHPAPPSQAPMIPRTPTIADPVIPPPPIPISEQHPGHTPRPRFTGFYRPADLPPPVPSANEPDFMPEPARPPAGPGARTPYHSSMPMPPPASTPQPMFAPAPSSSNPLPAPPADVWDTSPYRQVLANLPTDISALIDVPTGPDAVVDMPEPIPPPPRGFGSFFGAGSSRDKGKRPLKGLFRSQSSSVHSDLGSSSRHGHERSRTMTSIVIPPAGPSTSGMPVPSLAPPIRFDHMGEFAGFVNHSHHRVIFQNKTYPTALHLLEAMKFIHRPDLQERIRTCKDVHDMYPLSASFQEHVRSDWGQVFLQIMEDVLYRKFKQHPDLRKLLLRTGLADIIYEDENTYWGEDSRGQGQNELGKALVRVRERLAREGER